MFLKTIRSIPLHILCGLIQLYRWILSPFFGRQCRFQPTCSVYAQNALRTHGTIRGIALTLNRLRRCHPIQTLGADAGFTFDPVPALENPPESPKA